MVVQLFVTVALITSFFGQFIGISLFIRCPIEWILRFEHPIVTLAWVLNIFTGTVNHSFLYYKLLVGGFPSEKLRLLSA